MRRAAAALCLSLALTSAGAAQAGPASDEMGRCLVRATSDQDKTALMVWMFLAVSAHPAVKAYANVTDAQRQEANKAAAVLLQRLLTQDCRAETVAALKADGQKAITQGFSGLGQAGMMGLTQDPAVAKSLQQLVTYMDMSKLAELMRDSQ
jgi:hypothetical protein